MERHDEAGVSTLASKWMGNLHSHFSAVEDSRLEEFDGERNEHLEVNRRIAEASEAWFAEVRSALTALRS